MFCSGNQFTDSSVTGRNITEEDFHIAAADHTKVLNIITKQAEGFLDSPLVAEDLHGKLLASVFHRTAADGAADAAGTAYQHTCTGAARCGAATGNDGDPYGIFTAVKSFLQCCKQIFHEIILPFCQGSAQREPPSWRSRCILR